MGRCKCKGSCGPCSGVSTGLAFGVGAPTAFMVLGAEDGGESDTVVLRRVDAGVAQLVKAQQAEETRRKLTVILTAAGVVFAGIKLGFIAVPHFLRWKRGE